MFLLKNNVFIPDMRQSKTLDEQSMNAGHKSLQPVFSIAIKKIVASRATNGNKKLCFLQFLV